MSLLFRHPHTDGKLFQAGVREIPSILNKNNISLLILAAREYQPDYIPGMHKNLTIIYVPLKDTVTFTPKKFKKTINDAKQAANYAINTILDGKNVLSTCMAGWNRSGLISGLTLKKLINTPGKNIVKHIRNNRDWRALCNPLFADVITKI